MGVSDGLFGADDEAWWGSRRPALPTSAWSLIGLTLALVLSPLGDPLQAAAELRLGEHDFDWSTVEQERAHFRWSAEVVNDTTRSFDVEVAIDLLDDYDRVLHTDTGSVTVPTGETMRLEQEGSMPFDRATDVVSFRFRLVPSPPASR